MGFLPIGVTANLILNRLRIERMKAAIEEDEQAANDAQKRDEEAARAKLALVNKKLALLRARVEPRRGGSAG